MFEVSQEDYDMICSENKMFAEFLSNLGYSQEDISNIANSGNTESILELEEEYEELENKYKVLYREHERLKKHLRFIKARRKDALSNALDTIIILKKELANLKDLKWVK